MLLGSRRSVPSGRLRRELEWWDEGSLVSRVRRTLFGALGARAVKDGTGSRR
jgi:hypothetical protein